jgi:16S rRNA processing protein RimM
VTGQVELGRVIGAYGIKGWIRLFSYADPIEKILSYRTWSLAGREWKVIEGHAHSGAVVASLEGLSDRDAAAALEGQVIGVPRSALPKARKGEFYWTDVLGSEVVSTQGVTLGRLQSLTDNGAQDVMVVKGERERLIPFVVGPIVIGVDAGAKRILVDWDAEW